METRPYDHDDDLLTATGADGRARVRVHPWTDIAVVIGRGGNPDLELRLANIEADGVPLFKRPGGGCSVVLDPGNLILSVVLPIPGVGGITRAFGHISDFIISGLSKCGISGVSQEGVSDLVHGNRKIGGSCIYRRRDLLYYSTTFLVAPRVALMERYLQHPPREPDYRKRRPHKAFTTSLQALGLAPDPGKLSADLQLNLDRKLTTLTQKTCN